MEANLYWITTLIFSIIIFSILHSEFYVGRAQSKTELSYRHMMGWVLFFCFVDTIWGLSACHIIPGDSFLFLITTVFHIATVITTFFWLKFALVYLGDKVKYPRLYLILDGIVIVFEIIVVVINFFKPIMFTVVDGNYITGVMRPVTFVNQYIVYFVIGIVTLLCALEQKNEDRKKYFTVFLFSLAPILLGIFQLLYPEGPFYSMSYFLGCFMVHIFIVSRDRENYERNKFFTTLADVYYTVHILDLEKDTVERLLDNDMISQLTGRVLGCQAKLDSAMAGTATDEYRDLIMEFVDLSTISERMKDRNYISCEFIGKFHGWTRVTFISQEKDGDRQKKLMMTTQIVDTEKREMIDLLYRSGHDELSGLYNRRSYEEELLRLTDEGIPENLVYLSADLNGLKAVNDSLGHSAGDEIIIGAADCLKSALGAYGKVFRTGGDEFTAIFEADRQQLELIKEDLKNLTEEWSGERVDSISLSLGFVVRHEVPKLSINEIAILADKRMYENKSLYYRSQGMDRRGQKDAHTVACSLFIKILKVNLTDESYQIVELQDGESKNSGAFGLGVSGWIKEYAAEGFIYSEDVKDYYDKLDIARIRQHFDDGNDYFAYFYRRRYNGVYRKVMLEIVPAETYTRERQEVFLYIKCID